MPKLASSWENVIIDSHCLFFSNFMYRFLLILLFKENLDIYLTLCIVICKLCKSKTPSPVDIESFVNVDVVLDQTRIFLIFFYFINLYDMIYTLHTIPHQLSVEFKKQMKLAQNPTKIYIYMYIYDLPVKKYQPIIKYKLFISSQKNYLRQEKLIS